MVGALVSPLVSLKDYGVITCYLVQRSLFKQSFLFALITLVIAMMASACHNKLMMQKCGFRIKRVRITSAQIFVKLKVDIDLRESIEKVCSSCLTLLLQILKKNKLIDK